MGCVVVYENVGQNPPIIPTSKPNIWQIEEEKKGVFLYTSQGQLIRGSSSFLPSQEAVNLTLLWIIETHVYTDTIVPYSSRLEVYILYLYRTRVQVQYRTSWLVSSLLFLNNIILLLYNLPPTALSSADVLI